jgi:hypothetical protein
VGSPLEQTADALAAALTPVLTGHGLDHDHAGQVARLLAGSMATISGSAAGCRPALVRRTRSTLDNHDVEYGEDLVDQLVEVTATVLHQRGQLHDQRGATRHDPDAS